MRHSLVNLPLVHQVRRLFRGVHSAASGFAFPLGHWWLSGTERLSEPARLASGLVIVLPGIEGSSSLNWSIAQGLNDGGVRAAIRIHDWTTGFWPLFLFHLRAERRNREQARLVALMIADYQDEYPDRPVYLVGHSGGAALAVWALEALPAHRSITAALLLAPALSPAYRLIEALRRAEKGIWNFCSPLDLIFLTVGTLLFKTFDGRHRIAAGQYRFIEPRGLDAEEQFLYRTKLHHQRFLPALATRFHHGGHFGWANRVFVAESLAPLINSLDVR